MKYDKQTEQQIEILENKVKEVQEEIAKLKNNKTINTRWRAEYNESYEFIDNYGDSICATEFGDEQDNFLYSIGNYFKTKDEDKVEKCKKCLIITQKLKDIALRLNNGKVIDWNNNNQRKYFLYMYPSNGYKLKIDYSTGWKRQGLIYCLSDKFLETAIKEIGEQELIEYIKES